MKTLVDGLSPNGTTNQPIGLVWGWQSLVGGGPFGTVPVKERTTPTRKSSSCLSDGKNTQDRWYGDGSSTATAVDNRMWVTGGAGTCKNIKDTGVTIYAIQVNTGRRPAFNGAAELRDQLQQVRDAHHREPDRYHVPADRHAALAAARREVDATDFSKTKNAPRHAGWVRGARHESRIGNDAAFSHELRSGWSEKLLSGSSYAGARSRRGWK